MCVIRPCARPLRCVWCAACSLAVIDLCSGLSASLARRPRSLWTETETGTAGTHPEPPLHPAAAITLSAHSPSGPAHSLLHRCSPLSLSHSARRVGTRLILLFPSPLVPSGRIMRIAPMLLSLLLALVACCCILPSSVAAMAPVGNVPLGCILPLTGTHAQKGLRAQVRQDTRTQQQQQTSRLR